MIEVQLWENCCYYYAFRKQDDSEAVQKLAEVDVNGDGGVTWDEYAMKVFGYTSEELQRFTSDTDPAMETFNKVCKV